MPDASDNPHPTPTRRGRGDDGFTVLELLVVCAVIAALTMIAVPKYSSARKQAMRAVTKTNVQSAYSVAEALYSRQAAYPKTLAELKEGDTAIPWMANKITVTGANCEDEAGNIAQDTTAPGNPCTGPIKMSWFADNTNITNQQFALATWTADKKECYWIKIDKNPYDANYGVWYAHATVGQVGPTGKQLYPVCAATDIDNADYAGLFDQDINIGWG